jgi:predicted nucleotidyltransferase
MKLQMVKKPVIKVIRRFTEAINKKGITIDKVVLYGSYAKGRERPDSDIDMAIVSKDFGKDRTKEGMMLFRIAGSVDVRIEPVPISLESYEKDTWIPYDI